MTKNNGGYVELLLDWKKVHSPNLQAGIANLDEFIAKADHLYEPIYTKEDVFYLLDTKKLANQAYQELKRSANAVILKNLGIKLFRSKAFTSKDDIENNIQIKNLIHKGLFNSLIGSSLSLIYIRHGHEAIHSFNAEVNDRQYAVTNSATTLEKAGFKIPTQ